MPLGSILYQDEHLVAFDKPSGLLVHRGWADDETVAMTVVRDWVGRYVYPVHRLDRGTSGVVVFALDATTAQRLCAQLEARQVQKRYLALVRGCPPEEVWVDHPIPRTEDGPRVEALTLIRRLFNLGRYSFVEAFPKTGRLHQVRRHLKHLSHPIIGDVRYGKGEHNRFFREAHGLHRLALHAQEMTLAHPVSGATLCLSSPLPVDFRDPLLSFGLPEDLLGIHLERPIRPC